MAIIRARQPALTRLFPHQGNRRFLIPNRQWPDEQLAAVQLLNAGLATGANWTVSDGGTPPAVPVVEGGAITYPQRTGTGHVQTAIGTLDGVLEPGTYTVRWGSTVFASPEDMRLIALTGTTGGGGASDNVTIDDGQNEAVITVTTNAQSLRFRDQASSSNDGPCVITGPIQIFLGG